ncbi:MAG: ATPase, T2SS/T4P/T4SS family [Verrucomicrobiota bacterium]
MVREITEQDPLGYRIAQLSQNGSISDFYVTPNFPLSFKLNGKLYYDEFLWQVHPDTPLENGQEDYAIVLNQRRYRVSRMTTQGRQRWVLRLLPAGIPDPEDIGLPRAALKAYLEAKNGLFLVCGATGSGKSTTIASMVKHRSERRQEHVITFEDPIEYVYPEDTPSLVSQREIGTDAMDFAASLKGSLRQAPDVIIVGEIRDGETAEIALQASETGHVVIATLHTSSAAQTVQRFLKLIPSERVEAAQSTFADTLRMIMCQRLMLDEQKGRRFGIHEVLLQYDSVANIIRRGEFKKIDQELETGWKKGMCNFDRSIQNRVEEGWCPSLSATRTSGFGEQEVEEFLAKEEENHAAQLAVASQ